MRLMISVQFCLPIKVYLRLCHSACTYNMYSIFLQRSSIKYRTSNLPMHLTTRLHVLHYSIMSYQGFRLKHGTLVKTQAVPWQSMGSCVACCMH